MRYSALLSLLFVVIFTGHAYDLTGTWDSSFNAKCYITQIGNEIVWYAEDDPTAPGWSEIGHGTIEDDTIDIHIIDVPKGTWDYFLNLPYHDKRLSLLVRSNDEFVVVPTNNPENRGVVSGRWWRIEPSPFNQ